MKMIVSSKRMHSEFVNMVDVGVCALRCSGTDLIYMANNEVERRVHSVHFTEKRTEWVPVQAITVADVARLLKSMPEQPVVIEVTHDEIVVSQSVMVFRNTNIK